MCIYIPGEYSEDGLVLRHLRKQYSAGKLAVRDLCLRIQPGECFGFLGVNGAGKSTTFAMLTGATAPTSGDALLYGLSILSDQQALRRVVGYCPQHDALEGLLSARETLRMYARIKRVPSGETEAEVEALLEDLDLEAIADKPAGTYSGGNKRKLCVGIALVGSPRLVLLDEPSSGMDAGSKRFLWAVIRRRTRACCTVLTTHSMEECEALCARLGVMVDGVMRCVGPIQALGPPAHPYSYYCYFPSTCLLLAHLQALEPPAGFAHHSLTTYRLPLTYHLPLTYSLTLVRPLDRPGAQVSLRPGVQGRPAHGPAGDGRGGWPARGALRRACAALPGRAAD